MGQSIFLSDHIKLLKRSGWEISHIIDCPLSLRGVGSLRAEGNTAISAKHGEADAKEPNPQSVFVLNFENWDLQIAWNLGFEYWNLVRLVFHSH